MRFDDDWLSGSRRWLFSGRVVHRAAACRRTRRRRFDALLDLLRVEIERPPRAGVRGAAQAPARRGAPLGAALARGAAGGGRRHAAPTCSSTASSRSCSSATSPRATTPGHYAAELGVTTGTLSRLLTRLTGPSDEAARSMDRVILEAGAAAALQRPVDQGDRGPARLQRPVRLQQGLQAPARRGPARLPRAGDLPGREDLRVLDLVVREEEAARVPLGAERAEQPERVLVVEQRGRPWCAPRSSRSERPRPTARAPSATPSAWP